MKQVAVLLCFGIVLVIVSGCSISTVVDYQPRSTMEEASKVDRGTLTIGRFDDQRPGIKASDPKSASYVRHKATTNWGITYNGQRFIPVSALIQDVLRLEFESAGYKVTIADSAPSRGLFLDGTILNFGYQVEQGFPKSAFLRQVALTISLRDESGAPVPIDPVVNVTTREDGWGALVTDEIDRLVDETLREAARKIVVRVTGTVE